MSAKIFHCNRVFLLIVGISFFSSLPAADFWQVMQDALRNDTQLQKSDAQRLSTQQQALITRANLLPNLTGNGQYSRQSQNNSYKMSAAATGYGATLTQPVFDTSKWFNYRADRINSSAADLTYKSTLVDLIARTTQAYFAMLQQQNNLQLAQENRQSLRAILDQTKKRFNAGLTKTVDVALAQASFDAGNADVLKAQIDLASKQADLQAITNVSYSQLAALHNTFPLFIATNETLKNWQADVLQFNPQLLADKTSAQAAKEIINAQRAGHIPNLDASANFQHMNSNTSSTVGGNQTSVKFTLNIPLYAGGSVNAQTRKAAYDYQTQLGQLAIDYRLAIQQLQSSFAAVVNDEQRLKNDAVTIKAYQQALKNTQIAYAAGLSNTNINDLINVQLELYRAQRMLIDDQNDYVINLVKARQSAGLLTLADVRAINQWLR